MRQTRATARARERREEGLLRRRGDLRLLSNLDEWSAILTLLRNQPQLRGRLSGNGAGLLERSAPGTDAWSAARPQPGTGS